MRVLAQAITIVGLLAGLAMPGQAQQADADIDLSALELDGRILQMVARDPVSALESYLQQFFSIATSGTLTQEDVDTKHRMNKARRRAQQITQAMLLDLNGDLVITEEEIEQQRSLLNASIKARMLVMLAYGDTNRDRRLSFREVSDFVDQRTRGATSRIGRYEQLMSFDLNGDGKVIAWEIVQVIQAIEAQGPTIPRVAPMPDVSQTLAGCGHRKVLRGEDLVLVSAEAGAGLSNLTLAEPDGVTTVGVVSIEAGREPVTLMLVNKTPMIWRLRGQVNRVRQVIIGDGMTGVVGVPRDRVRIVRRDSCVPQAFAPGADRLKDTARKQLMSTFQVTDPAIVVQRKAIPVSVPSGQMLRAGVPDLPQPRIETRNGIDHVITRQGAIPIEGPNADLKEAALVRLAEQLRRQFPTGLHKFSDAAVHSAVQPRRTSVPGRFGLRDAISDGRLEVLPGNRYRITPSFTRFPEGLPTARFVLPTGVLMPSGLYRGIEVRAEGSGACLSLDDCRP